MYEGQLELSLAASTPGYKTGRSFEELPAQLLCIGRQLRCVRMAWSLPRSAQTEHSLLPRAQKQGICQSHCQPAVAQNTLSCFCLGRHGSQQAVSPPGLDFPESSVLITEKSFQVLRVACGCNLTLIKNSGYVPFSCQLSPKTSFMRLFSDMLDKISVRVSDGVLGGSHTVLFSREH